MLFVVLLCVLFVLCWLLADVSVCCFVCCGLLLVLDLSVCCCALLFVVVDRWLLMVEIWCGLLVGVRCGSLLLWGLGCLSLL